MYVVVRMGPVEVRDGLWGWGWGGEGVGMGGVGGGRDVHYQCKQRWMGHLVISVLRRLPRAGASGPGGVVTCFWPKSQAFLLFP